MLRFSIWLLVICGSIGQAQKCIEGRNITGHCSKFQVTVKSSRPEIKAKLFIAPGKGEFNGTIKIGSCEINGTITSTKQIQTLTIGSRDSFSSPITIVANTTGVAMQENTETPKVVCSTAPFTLTDGKLTTIVGLKIKKKMGAYLILDDSIEFVKTDKQKDDGQDVGLICGIVGGVVLIFIALVLFIGGCCCWCKEDKKKDVNDKKEDSKIKKTSQKKSVTGKSTCPTPVPMAQPKASMEWTAKDETMRTAEGTTSQSNLDSIGADRAGLIVQNMKKRSDKEHERAVGRIQEASQCRVTAKADPFIGDLKAETKKLEEQLAALESQDVKNEAAIAETKSKIAEYKQRKAKLGQDTLRGANVVATASTQASASTARSTVTAVQPTESNTTANNTTNDVTSKEATESKI
ncbi:hypothetical protein M3Y96_01014000 [Aphelenchoides besseyi]|nr:hypothetical protein M3Y96_01014000 [Aphelenchoides besseyi]